MKRTLLPPSMISITFWRLTSFHVKILTNYKMNCRKSLSKKWEMRNENHSGSNRFWSPSRSRNTVMFNRPFLSNLPNQLSKFNQFLHRIRPKTLFIHYFKLMKPAWKPWNNYPVYRKKLCPLCISKKPWMHSMLGISPWESKLWKRASRVVPMLQHCIILVSAMSKALAWNKIELK